MFKSIFNIYKLPKFEDKTYTQSRNYKDSPSITKNEVATSYNKKKIITFRFLITKTYYCKYKIFIIITHSDVLLRILIDFNFLSS